MARHKPSAPVRASLPEFIPPQLATLVNQPPSSDQWLHEIKLDGYPTAARTADGQVHMLTRSSLDWRARFRPIAVALAVLPVRTAYPNGKIAVQASDGVTSFAALQDALKGARRDGQGPQFFSHVCRLGLEASWARSRLRPTCAGSEA